jgi:Ca-activated chloride channel family protein
LIAPHLLPQLLVGAEQRSRIQPWTLLALAWVVATTALAGPTWQREPAAFAEDTAALAIVLKVTPSMQTADVQPTRLTRATEKIRDLLRERPGARTALYAYAGSVHRVLPLTDDADLVETLATELTPAVMPKPGDDPAAALSAAAEMLKSSGRAGSILWIADAAPAESRAALQSLRRKDATPVNVLATAGDGTERTSLETAARVIDASVVDVTPDNSDVQQLAREARYGAVSDPDSKSPWRDSGYWAVPLLTLVSLLWFRPGWVAAAGGN